MRKINVKLQIVCISFLWYLTRVMLPVRVSRALCGFYNISHGYMLNLDWPTVSAGQKRNWNIL